MYQAPIVAALIGVSSIWRSLGLALEKKGFRVPLFLHHYGFMYGMLSVLFYMSLSSMYYDIMVPSQWFNDEAVENNVRSIMAENGEGPEVLELWRNESTMVDFPGLKKFSLTCPLWVLLTLLVCLYHTHLHINKIRYKEDGTVGKLCEAPQHDQTLTVLILPLVYALMSFKSTQRIWQIMINHIPVPHTSHNTTAVMFHGYVERKEFLLEMYEANFMVGDIYETIALVTFGNLVMGVLKKKIDKMKAIFAVSTAERADGKEMTDYIEKLVAAMKTLTVAGVQLFALSCLLQGSYNLIISTLAYEFPDFHPELFSNKLGTFNDEGICISMPDCPGLFQTESMKNMSHYFFLGAGFIASFAAIGNIMIVEEDFEELLHEFSPSLKFWGTKILVSLAFLQSILITALLTPNGWSEVQSNLLYSSALCMECFLIATFHIKGWDAEEIWYGDYKLEGSPDTKRQPLLPAESK
jgi:hypothetical protein